MINKLRSFELLLVLIVAFAGSVIVSLSSLFSAAPAYSSRDAPIMVLYLIVSELSALAVLFYVLFRQGRTFKDIGLRIGWKDVPLSILVFIGSYISFFISYVVLYSIQRLFGGAGGASTVSHPVLEASLKFLPFIAVLINPFFEELIVRGYMITEVEQITRNGTLAVISSTLLQTIYHLYQGIVPALAMGGGFLFLSFFFLKKRRILPVILAHLYFDMLALVAYRT